MAAARVVTWARKEEQEAEAEWAEVSAGIPSAAPPVGVWADGEGAWLSARGAAPLRAFAPGTQAAAFQVIAPIDQFGVAMGVMVPNKTETRFGELAGLTFAYASGGFAPEFTVRDGDIVTMRRLGSSLVVTFCRKPGGEYEVEYRREEPLTATYVPDLDAFMVVAAECASIGDLLTSVNGEPFETSEDLSAAIGTAMEAAEVEGKDFITLGFTPLGGRFLEHVVPNVPVDGHLALQMVFHSMLDEEGVLPWIVDA